MAVCSVLIHGMAHMQFGVSDPENIQTSSESVVTQTAVVGVVQRNQVGH